MFPDTDKETASQVQNCPPLLCHLRLINCTTLKKHKRNCVLFVSLYLLSVSVFLRCLIATVLFFQPISKRAQFSKNSFYTLVFYGYRLNGSRRSSFYSSLLSAISIYHTTSFDISFMPKILHKQEKFWLPKN